MPRRWAARATPGTSVEPGIVYMAPDDHHLALRGMRLVLTQDPPERGHRPSVDVLFRSISEGEHGRTCAAALLTGMGEDRARGLEASRLGPLGVGGLADFVFASHREAILAGALTAHPGGGLKLFAAVGKMFVDDHSYFLKRLGAGYDFHFGRGSITPTLSLDLVEGEKMLVYGVALGVGF